MYKSFIVHIAVLVLICGGVLGLDQYIEDADRFPGWKGTLPKSLNVEVQSSVGFEEQGKVWMVCFWWCVMTLLFDCLPLFRVGGVEWSY